MPVEPLKLFDSRRWVVVGDALDSHNAKRKPEYAGFKDQFQVHDGLFVWSNTNIVWYLGHYLFDNSLPVTKFHIIHSY